MYTSRFSTTALVAILLVAIGAGLVASGRRVRAEPAPPESVSAVLLSYQGRLIDPTTGNSKPDGNYTFMFQIYNVATAGSPLWSETKSIAVVNGLFSTLLGDTTPLDRSIFDGQALWLGVAVGGDPEVVPRQPLAFVPYAILAKNAETVGGQLPTAFAPASHTHAADSITTGTLSTDRYSAYNDLKVENRVGSGTTQVAAGDHTHDGGVITTGTVAEPRIDTAITRDSEVMTIVKANDGAGPGVDADTVDGQSAAAFAAASHTHAAESITSGTLSTDRYSAYNDLRIENRVGTGTTQVAAGDHGHDGRYVKNAGDSMTGTLTVPKVAYTTPRTHYYIVGSEGFVPGSNVDYTNTYGNGGAHIHSGWGALVAAVHLPQGAVVTEFKVFFNDTSSSDMNVWLAGQSMQFGNYFILGNVLSTGVSGYGSRSTTSITQGTIDNTIYSYHVYAYSDAWDDKLIIKGALVTYQTSEAE